MDVSDLRKCEKLASSGREQPGEWNLSSFAVDYGYLSAYQI